MKPRRFHSLILGCALASLVACDPKESTSQSVASQPAAPLAQPVTTEQVQARIAAKSEAALSAAANVTVFDQPGGHEVFQLRAGQNYVIIKHGGPRGMWCKIRSNQQEGWIACNPNVGADDALPTARIVNPTVIPTEVRAVRDASVVQPQPTSTPPPSANTATYPHVHPTGEAMCATRCNHAPLFATLPEISADARAVLDLCPTTNEGQVTLAQVRAFVRAHIDDARLQAALRDAGRTPTPATREQDAEWMAGLWAGRGNKNAFTHVFCGDDWNRDQIGGLHFLPRFAQLEADGALCFDGPARGAAPTRNGQYLIRFHGLGPWSCANKPMGGFLEEKDPVAILAAGTNAYVHCCASTRQGGIWGDSNTHANWRVWCGTRNGDPGIASVYPTDERPTCSAL